MTHSKLTQLIKLSRQIFDPKPSHFVQFYQTDNQLMVPLSKYITSGLNESNTCVVIARQSRIDKLNEHLQANGINYVAAQASGQYITIDAVELLSTFMVNGLPDSALFYATVGGLVADAATRGKPIRAYGEMVALLWKVGNKEAVIELENLWNELGSSHEFSLYCAYPDLHFVHHPHIKNKISQYHAHSFTSWTKG